MKGFVQAIRDGEKGLIFRNSVFLPFHLEILSIWVGKEMSLLAVPDVYTDLSDRNGHIAMRTGETYTNIVFRKGGDLRKELGHDKGHIIIQAAEKGADIFRHENRHYIKVCFTNKHTLEFELVDDPFYL